MQMGMGLPAFLEAARHGILCTSGCDIITSNGGDLIGQLRLGLQDTRVRANDAFNQRGEMPLRLGTSSMDALAWGTINFHTHPYDIETVLIAGRPVKRNHRLVGVDYGKARAEAEASRNWIVNTVLRAKGTLLPPEESLSLISLEAVARQNMRR